jgi:hypothetical protein
MNELLQVGANEEGADFFFPPCGRSIKERESINLEGFMAAQNSGDHPYSEQGKESFSLSLALLSPSQSIFILSLVGDEFTWLLLEMF